MYQENPPSGAHPRHFSAIARFAVAAVLLGGGVPLAVALPASAAIAAPASASAAIAAPASAPAAPQVNPTDGKVISGSVEPGVTSVAVTDITGFPIAGAKIDSDGTFTTNFSPAVPDGTHVWVSAINELGEYSPQVEVVAHVDGPEFVLSREWTIDGVQPGGHVVVRYVVLNTGNTDLVAGSPATVTFDLAGSLDDATLPAPVVSAGEITVDGSDVTWSVPLKKAESATIDLELVVKATGSGGNNAITFKAFPQAPGLCATVMQCVYLAVVSPRAATAPDAPVVDPTSGRVVTGTAGAGSTVIVRTAGGATIGSAVAGNDGRFSVTLWQSTTHGQSLTVVSMDSTATESLPATVVVDSFSSRPVLSPTDGSRVSGGAEAGATITITDAAGATIATTIAGADGSFSAAISPAAQPGAVLTATATDALGNVSEPASVTVPAAANDTTAPAAPTVDETDGRTVSGTAEPGSVITVTDKSGAVVGTGTTHPIGTFDVPIDEPAEPGDELTVTATDSAGNVSPGTTVTVVGRAPVAGSDSDAVTSPTGSTATAVPAAATAILASTGVPTADVITLGALLLALGALALGLARVRSLSRGR